MKVFLPIIDNGGGDVKANWAMSMLSSFGNRELHIERVSDSHADRACNKAAALFLESECTDMLIIDADIVFTKKDIDLILSHDVPLVYGIYPKKHDETESCLGTFEKVDNTREDGLVEVRWAGRGFMRVKREVLEAMKEENGGPALRFHNYGENYWTFFASGPIEGDQTFVGNGKREWVSEDIMFCLRARKLGVTTYVDARIALGHEGSRVFRFNPKQVSYNVDPKEVKSWKDIHGWFDYEDLYRHIVQVLPDNGRFVEVGCWMGKSIAAFLSFAKEEGKRFNIHVVDTFQSKPANEEQAAILNMHGGNIRKMFEGNMSALGLLDKINVHAEDSVFAANSFIPGTVDAVFIDGDHSEEAVYKDICAWAPTLKKGGIIAGHDIDEVGVKQAVFRFFGTDYETVGRCWMVKW